MVNICTLKVLKGVTNSLHFEVQSRTNHLYVINQPCMSLKECPTTEQLYRLGCWTGFSSLFQKLSLEVPLTYT